VSEEGISFDCRGSSNDDGLAVASTTIATATGDDVTFSDTFPDAFQQLNQYVVFQTGPRKGEYYEIVFSGASGLGPYQLRNYVADPDDVGQTVTVQLGAFGDIIENNKVEDTGRTGILVYGSFIGAIVQNNETLNCVIAAQTLSGITSNINTSFQPCHYTKLLNNVARGEDIKISKLEYSGSTAIEPVGVELHGNRVNQENVISIEVGEKIVTGMRY
jgi:hypothetical protein